MSERDLKKELQDMGIISFDCDGVATKEDVFTALDSIKAHISKNSDEAALSHIEQLVAAKKDRMYKGNSAE